MATNFLPEKPPEYGQDPHCLALQPDRHIRFFIGVDLVREITQPIAAGEDVHIVCVLSGG